MEQIQEEKKKSKVRLHFSEFSALVDVNEAVYIGGSFVSKKKNPEDIDLCFDLSEADDEKLKREFPEFFGPNSHNNLGTIRRNLKCHIFTFDKTNTFMFEYLQRDRDNYPKGLVKISFKNGFNYD